MTTTQTEQTDQSSIAAGRRMSHAAQLSRQARRIPDAPALSHGGTTLTYAQLNGRVCALARGLVGIGVGRGDRVAVFMMNRTEVVESYLAVMKLGAVVVPVNFRLTAPEVEYIVEDSGAQVLIADDDLIDVAQRLGPVRRGEDSVSLVHTSAAPVAGARSYAALQREDDGEFDLDVPESDDAFIMYTSGTTGRPKGTVLTHMNLFMNSVNANPVQGVSDEAEVWLSGLPLFHIGGLNGILMYLLVGGHSVLMESGNFSAETAVATIEEYGVTACYFVPTQWRDICEVPDASRRAASLRRISWGASIAPPSTLQAMADTFAGVPNFNMFGQTEMSSVTCILRGEDAVRKMGSVGRPIANVEARIVDPDGVECPVGEVGEIVYRGPTVMREYWRNPQATAEAFRDGWFHSGDLCVEDEDGFITVVDRSKDMIISGGENIYSAEVEAAIDAHPKVREVSVVGRPHATWVETPTAFIVPIDDDDPPTEEEILAHCRERIASYKKPTAVVLVEELPKNAVGKIQKFRLREEAQSLAPELGDGTASQQAHRRRVHSAMTP
ncbi:MAG TPA: long-chain fatty acid--CoA ligase [Brevibacterium sp.]|nr:long-chain fatty acid--CoA ligase [Brevibacterium sp.]